MPKNNRIIISILLIAIFFGRSYGCTLKENQVRKTYTAEIGVRETGFNKGKRVEEYQKAANLKPNDAWCAAFITWTFKQCGIKTVISGYSPNWFPQRLVICRKGDTIKQIPDIGAVIGIWIKSKKRVGHVGFVDENWNNGSPYARSFEFNTNGAGSDDGNGNYYKRRLKSQIYVISSPITKEIQKDE